MAQTDEYLTMTSNSVLASFTNATASSVSIVNIELSLDSETVKEVTILAPGATNLVMCPKA